MDLKKDYEKIQKLLIIIFLSQLSEKESYFKQILTKKKLIVCF